VTPLAATPQAQLPQRPEQIWNNSKELIHEWFRQLFIDKPGREAF
jgi:hypothetical protein